MPGDKGAEEWGRRNGYDKDEARRKFHKIKQGHNGGPNEDYQVNPGTGDIRDGNGEDAGNMDE